MRRKSYQREGDGKKLTDFMMVQLPARLLLTLIWPTYLSLSDMERLREGMGDKVAICLQFISQFFAGKTLCFSYGMLCVLSGDGMEIQLVGRRGRTRVRE